MTVRKDAPVQPLQPVMDAAVEAATEDPITRSMEKMRQARTMTPAKAKKAARDKARKKVTLDLPEWLIKRLEQLAGKKGDTFPVNQLAVILMAEGLRALERGEIDLEERKIPSRVPAFTWFLQVDQEEDL